MLGTSQRKKQGFFRGCIVPILSTVAFFAACYALCSILFVLNGGQLSFAAAPTAVPFVETTPTTVPEEVPTPSGFYRLPPSSFQISLTTNWR